MVKIYDFGTAPRARSEGYLLVNTVHSTEQDLRSKHFGEDLIFVYGASVHGQPGVFEFARFEKKVLDVELPQPEAVNTCMRVQFKQPPTEKHKKGIRYSGSVFERDGKTFVMLDEKSPSFAGGQREFPYRKGGGWEEIEAPNSIKMAMKPGRFGKGPAGKPAIEWWRYGSAALGEPSIVTEVREYDSVQAQLAAIVNT